MRVFLLTYIFFLFSLISIEKTFSQHIFNIQVSQIIDCTVITYDLMEDKIVDTYDIKVTVSMANNNNFQIIPMSLEGDIFNVTAGKNKKIIWDVLKDQDELIGEGFIFNLTAIPRKVKIQSTEISGTFFDKRDGKKYKWVRIGEQIWMAENLAYLPSVSPPSNGSITAPLQYVYGYKGSDVNFAKTTHSYQKYGVLYNWVAAISMQTHFNDTALKTNGVCPEGWHVPGDSEWATLENTLTGFISENRKGDYQEQSSGLIIKSANVWMSGGGGLNSTGFSAIPGGSRYYSGPFKSQNYYAYWWSNSEDSRTNAWSRFLSYRSKNLERLPVNKKSGLSIRCIKD